MVQTYCIVPSLPSRKENLVIEVLHEQVDIKLFLPCPILLDFSILFQIFCPGLSALANVWS